MAFYINSNNVVNSGGGIIPASYSTRANLPTGSSGYISYVADQEELVVNLGTAVANTGIESSVKWYKFMIKPMDYKNEVIIEQGTVANGYVNSSIYNTIHRVVHAQDVIQLMTQTTPFTSKYGGWHSTYTNAYYHQGNNQDSTSEVTQGTATQDWATFTVTTLATRPTLNGSAMNSLQPGPKTQNTFGVLNGGSSGTSGSLGVYLTFATNTWATGYAPPTATNYGWGMFGQNYGYTWNYGEGSGTYKMNWSTQTWSLSAGNPSTAVGGSLGKALNTKWNKFYHIGDSASSTGVSKYNTTSDAYSTCTTVETNPQVEHGAMMGQDWGYLLGGYGPSGTWAGQNVYSMKMMYVSDSIVRQGTRLDGLNALSSSNACWGPM
jgi:hypothetical protein